MFDTILGLPTHILVIHAVVVLGPIAALAAIESLLSARVAAGMAPTGRVLPDREVVGQGLASLASGQSAEGSAGACD